MIEHSVAIGVQGAQTHTSQGRGLARYVVEQSLALLRHPRQRVVRFDRDPELPTPAELAAGPARLVGAADPPVGPGLWIYHVLSPFELVHLERIWPPWAQSRDVGLVVTLHDLIPLARADAYLREPHLRKWYLPRLQLVRAADAVVAISESTAEEGRRLLGLDADRIFVSYEDASELFAPPRDGRDSALAQARAAIPGLQPGFLLYSGGLDARKDVPTLLRAYGELGVSKRRSHQLVLVGRWPDDERRELGRLTEALGIADQALIAGYVPDSVLVALYQACELFVMPSLHEGFGLPALEAMRCGAPVLVADATALRELAPTPECRFEAGSAADLRVKLERVLGDTACRELMVRAGEHAASRFSWATSADRVIEAHQFAARRRADLLGLPGD